MEENFKLNIFGWIKFLPFILLIAVCFLGCNNSESEDLLVSAIPDFPLEIDTETDATELQIKRSNIPSEHYDTVTGKNLFDQDRDFKESAEDENIDPTPTPSKKKKEIPNLRLVGTISMPKGDSVAFILDSSNKKTKGKAQTYKEGDFVGEYRISDIYTDHVKFNTNGEVAMLHLKPAQNKSGSRNKRKPAVNSRRKNSSSSKSGKNVTSGRTNQSNTSRRPSKNSSKNNKNSDDEKKREEMEKQKAEMNQRNNSQNQRNTSSQKRSNSRTNRRSSACGR